jgi:5-methylcytosine-specific restriction endonuclease McrA
VKTLLLNDNFQIIAFISERKAVKLLLKDKVEVVSTWKGRKICSSNGYVEHPATLRMKYHISLRPTKLAFSRKLVLRRDEYTCGYCRKKCNNGALTIDHIIPKSAGGQNSFTNCVAACVNCNRKKRDRTPEQAGMTLKIKPIIPNKYLCYHPEEIAWHDDWMFFIRD